MGYRCGTGWSLELAKESGVWSLSQGIINNVLDKRLQELPGSARFSFGTGGQTTPSLLLLLAITFYQPTQNKRLARLIPSQVNPSDHTGKDLQSLSLAVLCSLFI